MVRKQKVAIAVGGIVVVLLVILAGLLWAKAPLERRPVLLDLPIALKTGAVCSGTFTPEHDGAHSLGLRFRRSDWPEILDHWPDVWPPGLRVRYAVRASGATRARGVADAYVGGAYGQDEITLLLAQLERVGGEQQKVEIGIDGVPQELTGLEVAFVVEPQGDWINYRQLEAATKFALVVALSGIVVAAGAIVVLLVRRLRRPHALRRKG